MLREASVILTEPSFCRCLFGGGTKVLSAMIFELSSFILFIRSSCVVVKMLFGTELINTVFLSD